MNRRGALVLARSIAAAALLAAVDHAAAIEEVDPSLVLHYDRPAAIWNEALPVGNGSMGAMVFGGTVEERIQFNEDTLWRGKPHDYARAGAVEVLPELRKLIGDGRLEEAEKLGRERFLGIPRRQMPYQPFGDVRLRFPGHDAATEYRRELDLERAEARVAYRVGDVRFAREVWASHPDKVIVVRLVSDRPGSITVEIALDSPHAQTIRTTDASGVMAIAGRVQEDGLRFEARLVCTAVGGTITKRDGILVVARADAVELRLVAATSFRDFAHIDADPGVRCEQRLTAIAGRSHATLRAAHRADHQALFGRVRFTLGNSTAAIAPTDARVRAVKAQGLASDPALAALHFNFGRYLLIASSRPGSQPANLQGVWNELLDPPWESKFTTNINFEMNYWPAEVTGLAECHLPMFDLIDDVAASGRRTAQTQYGARGWVLHHNTDLWRATAPVNNIDGIWPTGGAWLCWHLWEHYQFGGDRTFLERRAYPVMREACRFFLDTLVRDDRTGWLVTSPSFSPEQGSLTIGPAMDMQIIRALFRATSEAASLLGVDPEFAQQLDAARVRLAPDQVGRHGQLQEWLDDVDVPGNAHRHMSPLWAVFPGDDITPERPAVYEAARMLMRWRGDGSTGWSYAWRIPLWARMRDGEMAFRQMEGLLQRKTLPNLFDLCGPFQIDGNFGACAGVAEMLLQSHRRTTSTEAGSADPVHVLELLPALPRAWPQGAISGLRARGGFEVDLSWESGALVRATIRSHLGRPCRLHLGDRQLDLAVAQGATVVLDGALRAMH